MPPRARTGRGRGRGRGQASTLPSNTPMTQLVPFVGLPYTATPSNADTSGFQLAGTEGAQDLPLLPDPAESSIFNTVDQRLRAAAEMIQVSFLIHRMLDCLYILSQARGRETDVLAQHQQRQGFTLPSQNRLRASGDSVYSQSQSQQSSASASLYSTSRVSIPHAGYPKNLKGGAPTLSSFDKNTRNVVRAARTAAVNDMLLEVGWLYGDSMRATRKANLKENLYAAGSKLDYRNRFVFLFYFPSFDPTIPGVEWDENMAYLVSTYHGCPPRPLLIILSRLERGSRRLGQK